MDLPAITRSQFGRHLSRVDGAVETERYGADAVEAYARLTRSREALACVRLAQARDYPQFVLLSNFIGGRK